MALTRRRGTPGRSKHPQMLEYRFKIDGFAPETISMARLAEYMADLARLMGETEHVHFRRLEKGSAVVVPVVDWQAVPKVRARIHRVKRRQAPADVLRVADELNERLAEDNASATLLDPQGARVLLFRGRGRGNELDFAVSQPAQLCGRVIVIGGKNDPVPVHLEDGDSVHLCEATRTVARQLAPHLFGETLAVDGLGRWARNGEGNWELRTFRISAFRVLDDRPLPEVLGDLRRTGGEWTKREDPMSDLQQLRKLK